MYIDESLLNLLIGFLSALLLCGLIFWFLYQKKEQESRALTHALGKIEQENQSLRLSLSTYKERLEQISLHKEQMKQEFENLAHTILDDSAKKLTQHNSHTLFEIINPFKEHIQSFHDKVETFYHQESKERFSLAKEVVKLQSLNQQISQDALNLTNALKGDNKLQGDWGEMILSRLLESTGLQEGREYTVQSSFKDGSERVYRPDVIVHLPQKRDIIIDAKVSLKSYERYYHDKDPQDLKDFLHSVQSHIKGLGAKSYQKLEGIHTLDFVLLFIPIEGAFMLAMQSDKSLYQKAYAQHIIIVSPSTLLAVLRVIENSWRFEYQNKNAKIIAKKAGDMLDKFSAFVAEMQKVDAGLFKAKSAYDDALKKLSEGKGNLMHRAEELKALEGVVSKK